MRHVRTRSFSGIRPWDALPLATIDGASVKVHWTDAPYRWHVNDGEERTVVLEAGDAFIAHAGDAHMAMPQGACRVLVVERAGSQ